MTREEYIRLAGWVALGAALLIAALIPVETCSTFFGVRCGSHSLWRAITGGLEVNYRWPLRVGILAVGVLGVVGAHAITAPRRDKTQ